MIIFPSIFLLLSDTYGSKGNSISGAYLSLLQDNSNNAYLLLDEWNVFSTLDSTIQSVFLPYSAPENENVIHLRRSFSIPDSVKSHMLRIWILGIEGIVKINLNNHTLKKHVNFPSSYSIDIPDHLLLKHKKNIIELSIRKPGSVSEGIPEFVQIFRQKKYPIIFREIFLEWVPPIHFSDFRYNYIKPELSYSYKLIIQNRDTLPINRQKKIRITEEVYSSEGRKIYDRFEYVEYLEMDKSFNRKIQFSDVQSWSPQSPFLYQVKLRAFDSSGLKAAQNQTIAFKEFYTRNKNLYLNSKPIRIQGINYYEQYHNYKNWNGYSEFYKQLLDDLTNIKNMGFNAIRFPHSVPHPYVANLADSLGLFLFIENGIWRVPKNYFTRDQFLQTAKSIVSEILDVFHNRTSFAALGLGHDLEIHDADVQKFILILNEYLHQKYELLTYLSPVNDELLPATRITDFYLLNRYDSAILSHLKAKDREIQAINSPIIFANVGFASPFVKNKNADSDTYQSSKMQDFFRLIAKDKINNGFFIESFQDWEAAVPGFITQSIGDNKYIYPLGLRQWNGKRRLLYDKISYLLNSTTDEIVSVPEGSKRSNVFSLTVFISSVFFFLIYRRSYRLKENIKRSIAHPYGFFVDLRDRRIISIFNSTLIGLYTLLLLANMVAALVYYFHDNLFIEEHISVVLEPLGLKLIYLKISDSPLLLVLCTWLSFTLMQLFLVLFLRIISIFTRERIRNRQLLAVCNWAGSPILFLLPISLLSYQLLFYENFQIIIFIIIFLYFLWFNFRLGNGIRVLYIISSVKVYIIIILTYSIVLSIFGAFFKTKYDIINYFQLLKQAQNLFY